MRFTTLGRGGLQDDHGTEGLVLTKPGDVAIRAGETDIVISYDGETLSVKSYYVGDLGHVWDSFEHTDTEIWSWYNDDWNKPDTD
jgi:hypothetical protein